MNRRLTSVSLWLFIVVGCVYIANGRVIGAGDTLPARYLPFSLLRHQSFDLNEFPFLYDDRALRTYPVLDGIPYFLRYRDGHYVSAYSPATAIVALPVYALPVLLGVTPDSLWAPRLEKVSATIITALSVVFLYWSVSPLVNRRWALTIAVIYAFGTSSWSVSSQALWQHGPSQLSVVLLLYCLTRGITNERVLEFAGFAMTAAVVMRATDALIVLPVAAWILYAHRRLALRFVAFAALPAAALVLYNLISFGSPSGGAGSTTAPTWAFFAQVPLLEGLPGLLVSPSRGLFVYSPILLFALYGFVHVWRHGPSLLKPLTVGVVLVLLVVSKWFTWWGGYTWGPRLLADTTPIFCFFLYPLTHCLDRHRVLKGVFFVFAGLSIAMHALGVFLYDGRWDNTANIGRTDSSLWSWRNGPVVFYGREALTALSHLISSNRTAHPTSTDSPTLLAASYAVERVPTTTLAGEALVVSITARNTGRAVWLAFAPGTRGAVGLGWRWSRGGLTTAEGRAKLSSDVAPGEVAHFITRIQSPRDPGDYTLTIDMVSELVTWFADQGQMPAKVDVKVEARDPAALLADTATSDGSGLPPAASISVDRTSYRHTDSLHLTVELRNPRTPGSFDAYLLLQGPDRRVWFYDGHRFPSVGEWAAWVRELPMPAQATGRFLLPLSMLPAGDYRWHVVVSNAGSYHPVARADTRFTIQP